MNVKSVIILAAAAGTLALAGCSSKSNPTASTPQGTSTTVWDNAGFWTATINASSYTTPAYYSFVKKDTTTPGGADSLWDIGIQRTELKTNSGVSVDGGDVKGVALTSTNFAAVTAADSVGKTWKTDGVAYFINNWYDYNINTHQITYNRRVYTMNDATGHHYIKFRIDSLSGAGAPPNMGTVYLSYFYQTTVDSKVLTGSATQVAIPVGSNTVYFSFATGTAVTPANPKTSTAWDLMFSNFNVGQNSGPNGPAGVAAAFYVYAYLADPTDLNLVSDVYAGQPAAPMFPDAASSIFDAWYNYDSNTHVLTSKNFVYLVKAGGHLYKVQIYSYYANVNGVAASANYILYWNQMLEATRCGMRVEPGCQEQPGSFFRGEADGGVCNPSE